MERERKGRGEGGRQYVKEASNADYSPGEKTKEDKGGGGMEDEKGLSDQGRTAEEERKEEGMRKELALALCRSPAIIRALATTNKVGEPNAATVSTRSMEEERARKREGEGRERNGV